MSATFTALNAAPAFLGRKIVGKARLSPAARTPFQVTAKGITATEGGRPLWAPGAMLAMELLLRQVCQ